MLEKADYTHPASRTVHLPPYDLQYIEFHTRRIIKEKICSYKVLSLSEAKGMDINMYKLFFAIPTNTSGGAERVLSQIANYAAENGHIVYWINFDRDSNFYKLDSRINIVKLNIVFGRNNKLAKIFMAPVIEYKRFKAVRVLLKKEKPDVVVAFLQLSEMIFGMNCISLKIPFITSIRNDYNAYGFSLRAFRRFAYPQIKTIICQTHNVQKKLKSQISCNSFVIPNPLSNDSVAENDYIGKDRTERIICVGRLCEQKNFELLISAMNKVYIARPELKRFKVEIYGNGTDKNKLLSLINEMGLVDNIKLMGVVPNILARNNDASLYVMSSSYEGFPNTLAEAMANGIPSISTAFSSGAANELIGDNERGRLVPVGDIDELANAIIDMLSNPSKADELASKAKTYMKQFKSEVICEKWLSIILNAVN